MIRRGSVIRIGVQVSPKNSVMINIASRVGFARRIGLQGGLNRTYAEIATITLSKDYQTLEQLRTATINALSQSGWNLAYYPEISIEKLVA
jgi:hypothetical protein